MGNRGRMSRARAKRIAGRALVAAALVALGAGGEHALALAGEFTEETRRKLERLVTVEREEGARLAEFANIIADQTGLSFAASGFLAHLPEPVAVFARDVPAGELMEAVAHAMHLEFKVTPGGIVSVRLPRDDPRRMAFIARMFPPPRGGEHGEARRERQDEDRPGEDEIIDRVAGHPKVRAILEKLDAELEPAQFHPGKELWVLTIRRRGEKATLGRVIASADGEVRDIKVGTPGRKADKPKKKRPEPKPEDDDNF